jgi:hypothetical protein
MEMNILRSGAKPRAKLDKVQAEIAQVELELKAVENGNVSIEQARERLTGLLTWPVRHAGHAFGSLLARNPGNVALPTTIGLGEYAYLHGPDAFIDSVIARIADYGGLPPDEHAARLQGLRQKLRSLQIAEEQEVLDLSGAAIRCYAVVMQT